MRKSLEEWEELVVSALILDEKRREKTNAYFNPTNGVIADSNTNLNSGNVQPDAKSISNVTNRLNHPIINGHSPCNDSRPCEPEEYPYYFHKHDNSKIPVILSRLKMLFGGHSVAYEIVAATLLHQTLTLLPAYPPAAPCADDEAPIFVNERMLSILRLLNIVDSCSYHILNRERQMDIKRIINEQSDHYRKVVCAAKLSNEESKVNDG